MAPIKSNEATNIVIADDDATTRYVLRLLLTENRFNVVGEAPNGEKAVELCTALMPDFAFLDIDMPILDGKQAAIKIRQTYPAISIVMISAISTLENVRGAMQAGAGAFVVKPFTAVKLLEAMETCRKKKQ